MTRLLVLRPEPGASATAARARAAGFAVTVAPLFTVGGVAWEPPAATVDAVMMTSANAARFGGPGLAAYVDHPLHVVGMATAQAALLAGFQDVTVGGPDATALVASLAGEGRVLHLAGRDHRGALPEGGVRRVVYAADAVAVLPDAARQALAAGAVALLHSPRAATVFAALVDKAGLDRGAIGVGALSAAVAGAAGSGWRTVRVAAVPEDAALLRAVEVAAR